MIDLTEPKLDEPAVMEWLEELGFERAYGPEIFRRGSIPSGGITGR